MDKANPRSGNACERCGKRSLSPLAHRIAKLSEPGYVDIFRCESCGHVSHHDTSRAAPED
jgi:hypothetical protein